MTDQTLIEKKDAPLQPATPMDLLGLAVEKGLDVAALEKLMDLQERWQAGQAKAAFDAAMAGFQANCPTMKKTRKADRYNYAPLDEILRTIRPILEQHGLSVTFDTEISSEGILSAVCKVAHIQGHSETSRFTCPVDRNMKVNDSQKQGSANSYAKRYALKNALNLVESDEDDDGFAGGTAFIDKEQIANIEALITEIGASRAGFLKWAGVRNIANIPADKYQTCISVLEKKRSAA